MNRDTQEQIIFLQQQLQWSKKQAIILEEIDELLHEMKKIALYALDNTLTTSETADLNEKLARLKTQVHFLEKQLHSEYH